MLELLHIVQTHVPEILVAIIAVIFSFIIYVAHQSNKSNFNVFDYFLDPVTGKASITRTLQMLAGLTATGIVITFTIGNSLTVEFFSVYLAAMGISEGWAKFVGAKYMNTTQSDK